MSGIDVIGGGRYAPLAVRMAQAPEAFDLIVCPIFGRQKNSGPKAAIP
jgi:hypothetical protein